MKLWPFQKRKPRPVEHLQTGLLRSTEPSARAHDHFNNGMLDVSNNALVSEAERSRLRSWCKKEYLDNAYARNAARNFALGVYGSGPKLEITTENEAVNTRLEKFFRKWRKKTGFDWKMFIAIQSLFYDGEAFFLFYDSPQVPAGVNVELVEARRIRDPYGTSLDENRFEGIVYNAWNEPVWYHVSRESVNPHSGYAEDFVTIPASAMMHLFLDDVVNQKRGLPMLQSVLETLASLQRIGRASLNAWELAAKMNLVIQTGMDAYDFIRCAPKGGDPEGENAVEAFKTIPVPEDGGFTFLATGMNMQQVRAEHPNSQFHDNKTTYLTEIGAGVGEPRNIVTGDSSAYNFSSAQLDDLMFRRWGGTCQLKITEITDRTLVEVLESGIRAGEIAPEDMRFLVENYPDLDDLPFEWHFPTVLETLDRVNNASAEVQLLQAGLLTRKEYCKRHGIDYEKHMAQLQAETQQTEK